MYQVPWDRKGVPPFSPLVALRLFLALSFLFFAALPAWSQEDSAAVPLPRAYCEYFLLDEDAEITMQAQLRDADGRAVLLDIRWLHHHQARDTFELKDALGSYVYYLTDGQERFALSGPANAHLRRLATHHLREPLFGSRLLYDDLELVAKGAYKCRNGEDLYRGRLRTALSQAWYYMKYSPEYPPIWLGMNGSRYQKREVFLKDWALLGKNWLPRRLELRPGGFLEVTQWRLLPTPEAPPPPTFWSFPRQ